jgi:hypothetical protein
MPWSQVTAPPRKLLVVAHLLVVIGTTRAAATPQFARRLETDCSSCHLLPPVLNATGLAFQASGYVPPWAGATDAPRPRTIPMAAWVTVRAEDQGRGGASELFLPKIELISGGRFAESWSYFAEWRPVSLSLDRDGSLRDRGGRFEDLFVERSLGERQAVRVGQYRALNQFDVSLRLSASEPSLVNNNLPTGSRADARLAALDRFSPAARSPSIGYSFRSLAWASAGDGLFHFVTVPLVGDL